MRNLLHYIDVTEVIFKSTQKYLISALCHFKELLGCTNIEILCCHIDYIAKMLFSGRRFML